MAEEMNARRRLRPGYRQVQITVPADLVVRIDMLGAARGDYPSRSDLVAEALTEYVAQRDDMQSGPRETFLGADND